MIHYDTGTWGLHFAFQLKGSVFPKAVIWAIPCAIISACWQIVLTNHSLPTLDVSDVGASVFGGFSFILGFLIVFRSQQAYSRWWEGGTLMQQLRGEWFNSYSCLIAFCNHSPELAVDVRKFQHQLVRLYSLLYALALQQVSTLRVKKFQLIDITGISPESARFLETCPDRSEVVLQWIQRLIVESESKSILKIAPPILSRVYNELGNGIVNLNNARKITQYPMPFPLAQMITVMLLFHTVITPFICAASVLTPYWAFAITFIVTLSYWSINYIANEIEMPFGDDLNDLPLHDMMEDMNSSLRTLVKAEAQTVPDFHFVPEFHEELQTKLVDFDDLVDPEDMIHWFASNGIDPKDDKKKTSLFSLTSVRSAPRETGATRLPSQGSSLPRSNSAQLSPCVSSSGESEPDADLSPGRTDSREERKDPLEVQVERDAPIVEENKHGANTASSSTKTSNRRGAKQRSNSPDDETQSSRTPPIIVSIADLDAFSSQAPGTDPSHAHGGHITPSSDLSPPARVQNDRHENETLIQQL